MAVISGNRFDPLRGFRYIVDFTVPGYGTVTAGFQRVSGLREQTDVVEYRNGDEQGGKRKIPGLSSYDDLVLERGMPENTAQFADVFSNWRKKIQDADTDGDTDEENIRGSVIITVYKRGDVAHSTPQFTYSRSEVWPSTYEHGDLSGTDSEVWIEKITLSCEKGSQSVG